MDRFLQLAQNYWIRFVGFFYRIWAIVRQVFTAVFGVLARLFGLTQPTQYVELDQTKESEAAALPTANSTPSASTETNFATRYVAPNTPRRSDDNMDYYRRLARQIQNTD